MVLVHHSLFKSYLFITLVPLMLSVEPRDLLTGCRSFHFLNYRNYTHKFNTSNLLQINSAFM